MSRKQDSLTKSFSGEFNTCTVEKSRYFYAFLMAGKSFTPTILIKVNEQHNYHSREIVHTQHLTGKFLYIYTLFYGAQCKIQMYNVPVQYSNINAWQIVLANTFPAFTK